MRDPLLSRLRTRKTAPENGARPGRKLYLRGNVFACRVCHELTYESTEKDEDLTESRFCTLLTCGRYHADRWP